MAVKPGESMTVEQRVAVKERALKTLQSDDGVIRLGHVIDAVFDAFEAGRASRDAWLESMQHELDTANEANAGLRAQLAEKDADAQRRIDGIQSLRTEEQEAYRAGLAEKDAEIARLRASIEHVVNKYALSSGNHIGSALRFLRAAMKDRAVLKEKKPNAD